MFSCELIFLWLFGDILGDSSTECGYLPKMHKRFRKKKHLIEVIYSYLIYNY